MRKNTKLKGAVLITGAAKRIGQVIALHLSQLGYAVALHYHRSRKEALHTAEAIKKENGTCALFRCDLSKEKAVKQLIAQARKKFPQLNVLINNASVFQKAALEEKDALSFDKHFSVNLKGPYLLSMAFARHCSGGIIINITDALITKNKTNYFPYLLSKKALEDFTEMAACSLAPNIRVNAIAPGIILPPEGKSKTYVQNLVKHIPLKRQGKPEHVARAVQFLIEHDYLTGQILYVDGGRHLI